MKDRIRNEISKFTLTLKWLDLPSIKTNEDLEKALKNTNHLNQLENAALAVLQYITQIPTQERIPNVLERMELAFETETNRPRNYTSSILGIVIVLAHLWDADSYANAKKYAKDLLQCIIDGITNTDESNLFVCCDYTKELSDYTIREQPLKFDKRHQHQQTFDIDEFDYRRHIEPTISRRLLRLVLSICVQILDVDTPNILQTSLRQKEHEYFLYGIDRFHNRPIAAFAYHVADNLWQLNAYEAAIIIYDFAIRSDCEVGKLSIEQQLDAYNVWGLCKIELGDLNSAYSIFEKGINAHKEYVMKNGNTSSQYNEYVARIYANMAYVCGSNARDAVDGSKEEKKHYCLARSFINNSLELDAQNASTLSSSATLHYFCDELEDALNQYDACRNLSKSKLDKLSSLGNCIEIRLELLCREEQKHNNDNSNPSSQENTILQHLEEYRLLYEQLKDERYLGNEDYYKEIAKAKTILSNFTVSQDIHKCKDISMCLLQIYRTAENIKSTLRYDMVIQSVNSKHGKGAQNEQDTQLPIAYYTTMENVKYLLDKTEVLLDESPTSQIPQTTDPWPDINSKDVHSKNCLTMMHVYYMNDPSEGCTLLQSLSDSINGSNEKNVLFQDSAPSIFREKLLDEKFVFLKSFTSLVDQLNMWTMYASDRSNNSDSNGCCICIAPESFHMMLNAPQKSNNNKQLAKNLDDFHLYRVAYVQNGKICSGTPKLAMYYNHLNTLIVRLNNLLIKHHALVNTSSIWTGLSRSLAFIAFLFKEASYSAEKELRLVITREKTDKHQIKMTKQTPPKLYITPPHQIYANNIILGPKLLAQDKWIPYLQYKLVDMWETWPEAKYGPRVPKVRKSTISYRD